MHEAYWREFVDIKIAEQYFLLYIHNSRRWQFAINAFCLVVSFTGVVTWIGDWLSPAISGIIILVSQVVSILQPLYPHSDRLFAGKCVFSELKSLALSAEQTWNQYLCGSLDEAAIASKLKKLQLDLAAVEDKFVTPELFPPKMRLHKKAEKTVEQFLRTHYDLKEWK